MTDKEQDGWQIAETSVFWGEIAPTEHVVQIYENDESFLISKALSLAAWRQTNVLCSLQPPNIYARCASGCL